MQKLECDTRYVLYVSDHDFGIRMSVWNNKALVTKEQWKSRTSSNLLLSLLTGRNFLTRNWFFSWIIFLLYTNLLELFFTSILVFVWQVACSFELQYWKILCIRPGTLFALWRLNEKVQLQGIILIYTQSIIYVLNPEKVCIGIQINELYPIYTRSDSNRLLFFLLCSKSTFVRPRKYCVS